MNTLFGISTMKRFKSEQKEDYMKLLRSFEKNKRIIQPDTVRIITFDHVHKLLQLYKQNEKMSFEERIASLGLSKKLKCDPKKHPGKFRLDASIIRGWFEKPIAKMISHVKAILAKPHLKNVKHILLVGGFGESDVVYETLQNTFSKTHQIIRPPEASLAVLFGAVQFGHNPFRINPRIMKATYGIGVMNKFDEKVHPASRMIMVNNKKMVKDIFHIFVHIDDSVYFGKDIQKHDFTPTDMQHSDVPIYKSAKHDPVYVSETGCTKLGELTIDHPEGNTLADKKFSVTFVFGDTELYVKVKIQKTGVEFTKYVNALEN